MSSFSVLSSDFSARFRHTSRTLLRDSPSMKAGFSLFLAVRYLGSYSVVS